MQVGVMMLEVKQKDKDNSNKLGRLSVSREQATGQASYKDPAAQLTCSLLGLALKGKQNKDREKKKTSQAGVCHNVKSFSAAFSTRSSNCPLDGAMLMLPAQLIIA